MKNNQKRIRGTQINQPGVHTQYKYLKRECWGYAVGQRQYVRLLTSTGRLDIYSKYIGSVVRFTRFYLVGS